VSGISGVCHYSPALSVLFLNNALDNSDAWPRVYRRRPAWQAHSAYRQAMLTRHKIMIVSCAWQFCSMLKSIDKFFAMFIYFILVNPNELYP